jgi:hypothetical protein
MFIFQDLFQEGEVRLMREGVAAVAARLVTCHEIEHMQILSPYSICLCILLFETEEARANGSFNADAYDRASQFLQSRINVTFPPLQTLIPQTCSYLLCRDDTLSL